MFARTLLSAALLAASTCAMASDYFVVVPVHGKSANTSAISVSLGSPALPSAQVGSTFSFDFKPSVQVTGDPSYSGFGVKWSVLSGSLPAGLTLDAATGVLSGVPTAAGTSDFVVSAEYKTKTGQKNFQVVTAAMTVTLAGASLPLATQGANYSYDFKPSLAVSATNYSSADVAWSLASGTLPSGMSLSAAGVLSGTAPVIADTGAAFTVSANYKGQVAQQSYTLFGEVVDPYWANVDFLAHLDGTAVNAKTGATLNAPNITYSTSSKFGPNAAVFNGSSSTIDVPKVTFGAGDFTVEGWAYAAALANSKVLFSNSNVWANSTGSPFWLGVASSGDTTRLEFANGGNGNETISAGGVLPLNQWFHWAVVRQSGVVRAFVDGVQVLSTTAGTNLSSPNTASTSSIGRLVNGQFWNGRIDEVRVTTGVARYGAAGYTVPVKAFPSK